jgi:hypothetical protein
MADAVAGTRRIVVLVCAIVVLGLTVPGGVSAEPPPPPPNLDIEMARVVEHPPTAARRGDHGLVVAPIGINAWVAITNQWR